MLRLKQAYCIVNTRKAYCIVNTLKALTFQQCKKKKSKLAGRPKKNTNEQQPDRHASASRMAKNNTKQFKKADNADRQSTRTKIPRGCQAVYKQEEMSDCNGGSPYKVPTVSAFTRLNKSLKPFFFLISTEFN
jgi:hypothetical protein